MKSYLNWLIVAVIVVSGAIVGCKAPTPESTAVTTMPASLDWRWVEVSSGGKTAAIEVLRYPQPVALQTVPLERAKRDTPTSAWVSFQSYQRLGKDEADLQALAQHFNEPAAFMDSVQTRGHVTATEYFERMREIDLRPAVLGLVRYRGDVLVVYQVQPEEDGAKPYITAVRMKYASGKYVIRWGTDDTDPILNKLRGSKYALAGFGQ